MMRQRLTQLVCAALLLPIYGECKAQTTLEACYAAAERNYPLVAQYGLIDRSLDYTLENASRSWWPQVQVGAKAQVQSDVTSLPFDLAQLGITGVSVPEMKKDQYAVTATVQQTLYDGGSVKASRKVSEAGSLVEKQQVKTSLYALRQQVNQLFFGILLTDEQLRLNALLQDNLRLNADKLQSMIEGGLAHDADLDAVRVEQVRAEQRATDYTATRTAYIRMLAQLTGLPLSGQSAFAVPALPALSADPSAVGLRRPEMQLYAAQLHQIDARQSQLDAALRPRLSLSLQGGYGRPGLNLLEDGFKLYGVAALNLTWNLSSLYTRRADRELLRVKAGMVENAQDVFLHNLKVEDAQQRTDLDRYAALLERDDEVIRLRERIRRSSEAKLLAGTLDATDLMRDINDEQEARLDRALHSMQQLLAAYHLKYTTGE